MIAFASTDLLSLVALAFVLGLRHGVDADHLAAIDVMARFNAASKPALARLTGLWFSVGHGAIVLVVAFGVAAAAHAWHAPGWLEPAGAWISIGMLLLLGIANLWVLQRTPRHQSVRFAGWRSALYRRLLNVSGAGPILGIGALFAISFDTLSQAALMGATGTAAMGMTAVAMLAGAFVLGMMVTDGLNGWFVANLLSRAQAGAPRVSRLMAFSVSGVSIGTAVLGATARLSSSAAAWAEVHQGRVSLLVVWIVLGSFAWGWWSTRAAQLELTETFGSLSSR